MNRYEAKDLNDLQDVMQSSKSDIYKTLNVADVALVVDFLENEGLYRCQLASNANVTIICGATKDFYSVTGTTLKPSLNNGSKVLVVFVNSDNRSLISPKGKIKVKQSDLKHSAAFGIIVGQFLGI